MSHWFAVDWESPLGAGGEGEVYLGRSLDTWELCAVKVSSLLDPEQARQQLAGELERCSRVAGAGVVGLVAWNLDAPRPFLVFELARAGTLADEMRAMRERGRTYHPARALVRVRQVLVALSHLHSRGMVHRDVKPANLLRFRNQLKITDFGAGTSKGKSTLASESFVGTRAYAAPEQLAGGPADDRGDLYAVGCILHEMLTGALPPRPIPAALRYPSVLVLPELDQLLKSLLADDKEHRPPTAGAALERVDWVLSTYARARRAWRRLGLGPSPY